MGHEDNVGGMVNIGDKVNIGDEVNIGEGNKCLRKRMCKRTYRYVLGRQHRKKTKSIENRYLIKL